MSKIFQIGNEKKIGGFSLIELLVSIAILGAILSVVLFNTRSSNEKTGLAQMADELAVDIAQAQVNSLAVRERTAGSSDFNQGYGISLTRLVSGSNAYYISYVDRNGNLRYDNDTTCPTAAASECLKKTNFKYGNVIHYICVIQANGGDDCNAPRRADIAFLRPDSAARITFYNNGGQIYSPASRRGVKIILRSAGNLTRSVSVYDTGQISVQ